MARAGSGTAGSTWTDSSSAADAGQEATCRGRLPEAAYSSAMSAYVTSRTRLIAELMAEHAISELEAHRLLTEWEYEANRRGLDQRTAAFWQSGRAWIDDLVASRESS